MGPLVKYVLDPLFGPPGIIVAFTSDPERAATIAADYGRAVGRPIVITEGPAPDSAPLPSSVPGSSDPQP